MKSRYSSEDKVKEQTQTTSRRQYRRDVRSHNGIGEIPGPLPTDLIVIIAAKKKFPRHDGSSNVRSASWMWPGTGDWGLAIHQHFCHLRRGTAPLARPTA